MPPSDGTRGLTAEQKIVYQKERNKIKQRDHRARKKAEKERSSSSGSLPTPTALGKRRTGEKGSAMLDLGEGGFMMEARRAVELQEEAQRRREGGEEGSSSLSSGVEKEASRTSSINRVAAPRLPSPTSVPSSKLTSVSLFATLLNGGSLPRAHLNANDAFTSFPGSIPLHQPFPSSSTPSSSGAPHQLALQRQLSWPYLPNQSQPEPSLPSYTYSSPANIGSFPFYNPLNSIDWKWRLFQAHSALYQDRDHPTKGYHHNSFAEETITTAQTLILQLLAATSPPGRKEQLDARRILSAEDEEYLRLTPMDRRIEWMPDPLVRVNAMKASRCGLVSLTEKAAAGIETATIFGDAMDSGAWMLQNKVSLDTLTLYLVPSTDEAGEQRNPSLSGGDQLHGASVREIVLGLELPGWRTDEPLVQPAPMSDSQLEQSWQLEAVMMQGTKTFVGMTSEC
ncbi:hypothetical protein BDY24DRAFT_373230 [Mrakia frigida]|uniref:uncharacterized protein n=1 Tax=Mrakia frigida TaxID=29902 RepID=UPI003FCC210A